MDVSTRPCSKCNKVQPLEEFLVANPKTGTRRRECRSCRNPARKEWQKLNGKEAYQRYKEGVERWKRQRVQETRDAINKLKEAPCTDCHHSFNPWVMDFDHVDPSTKSNNVATLVLRAKSLATILAEIDKCELVCANCHRDRTHRRQTTATPKD